MSVNAKVKKQTNLINPLHLNIQTSCTVVKTNEQKQIFSNIYDGNFLTLINELSSTIQIYHNNTKIILNKIKLFFNEENNKQNEIFIPLHKNFNEIEQNFIKFYSEAKTLFKKMKSYRSKKMNNLNKRPSFNDPYKSITNKINSQNKNKNTPNKTKSPQPLAEKYTLNTENNINNDNNFQTITNINGIYFKTEEDELSSDRIQRKTSDDIQIENTNNSSINTKDNNIIECLDDILNEIKNMQNNFNNNYVNNCSNDLFGQKKLSLLNLYKNYIDENKVLKDKFIKYKSDEQIRKKFLENQIISLTEKIKENENKKKNVSQINNEIASLKNIIAEYEKKINELNAENKNLKTENSIEIIAKNNEILEISENLREFAKKCDVTETEKNSLSKEMSELSNKNNLLLNKISQLNLDINNSLDKISDLQKTNDTKSQENITLKEKIEELESKYKNILEELTQTKKNNELMSQDLEEKNKIINEHKDNDTEYKTLKKEIKTLNNEIKIKKDEISIIKKKLMDKDESIKTYKKKYEAELKKNTSLENQILDLKENLEQGTNTEYESRRKIKKNNLIPGEQKKMSFLYKTLTNMYQNKGKNENNLNSARQRKRTFSQFDNNLTNTNTKNNDTASSTTINNNTINNEEDNISYNSNNINNNETKITPENYTCIKCYQLNNKLKWYLFKKINYESNLPHLKPSFKKGHRYSMSMRSNYNINDISENNINYNDYVWLPYKNEKDFNEFGELPKSIDEIKDEENLIKIEKLEKKVKEKENEIINLNNNYNKNQEKLAENIEKLKKENNYLNTIITKYKNELKNDKNFIGVSFIDEDPECSKFIDDKCFEELLTDLEKENSGSINKEGKYSNVKNLKKTGSYNANLKSAIDCLLTQVVPSQNARITLASILRQLGCSDEDIYKLIGNYRGVINIPFSSTGKNK